MEMLFLDVWNVYECGRVKGVGVSGERGVGNS